MNIKWIGARSDKFEVGRRGKKPDMIVLHWMAGTLAATDATFNNSTRIASAQYGIGNTVVHQYVKEEDTAYHAGVFDINLRSIGIEHEGGPTIAITEATYKTSAQLVADIAKRWNIPLDTQHVRVHNEFKATQCPGTLNRDRIIRDAKSILSGGGEQPVNNDVVTIPASEFPQLVHKATQWDKTVGEYLPGQNPKDTIFESIRNIISGIKSRVTDLTKQLSDSVVEMNNRSEQVSRLKEQVLSEEKLRKDLTSKLNDALKESVKIVGVYDGQLKEKQGVIDQLARDKGDLARQLATCQAATGKRLDIASLAELSQAIVKRIFRI